LIDDCWVVGRWRWAKCSKVFHGMSYVLHIDWSYSSRLFTLYDPYVWQYEMFLVICINLPYMIHMYETSHVVLSYYPRWAVWDEPCGPQLFNQDELCAPYQCVLYLNVIYPRWAIWMKQIVCSIVICPGWAMCSLSMDPISHGYLPMSVYTRRMSFVLPIDIS